MHEAAYFTPVRDTSREQRIEEIASHHSPTMIPDVAEFIESFTAPELWHVFVSKRTQDARPIEAMTLVDYERMVKRFHELLPGVRVADMRHRWVWDHVRKHCDCTESLRNKTVRCVSRMVRYFFNRGLISWKPDCGPKIYIPRTKTYTPTVEDLGRLYRGLEKHVGPKRRRRQWWIKAILATQYFTGLRISAVAAIKWKHIHRVGNGQYELRLIVPKTRKEHCIPIHPMMFKAIHLLHRDGVTTVKRKFNGEYGQEQFVFPRVTRGSVNQLYVKASQKAGLPHTTSHAIRRASISQWGMIYDRCGGMVHGSGTPGSLIPYYAEEQFLRRYMMRIPVPLEWYPDYERSKHSIPMSSFITLYDSLTPEQRRSIMSIGEEMVLGRED